MKRGEQKRKLSDQQRQLAVYGIYPDCSAAGAAFDALREAAFSDADLSFLLRVEIPSPVDEDRSRPHSQHAPACAARLGDPVPVNLPEVGDVLASGPIRTTLTSVDRRGHRGVRLAEALAAFGFPPYQVPLYENAILKNSVLAIVTCGHFEAAEQAVDLLEGTGAFEIGALRR